MSAIESALSGLKAAETRLAQSAKNIANQFSEKTRENGQTIDKPYTPQRVDQVTLSPTGAVLAQVKDVNPATLPVPDTDPRNATGVKQMPNVNLEEEIVQQILARRAFEANLATIRTQKTMDEALNRINTKA